MGECAGRQQLLLNSMSRTQFLVEQSQQAIQDLSGKLASNSKDGKIDEILPFYDDDIEFLESQTPTCRGIDALRIYYETMKRMRLMISERYITELHTLSPFIVLERGKYKIPRSKHAFIEGRYFSLWIDRGEWKIIQECRMVSS